MHIALFLHIYQPPTQISKFIVDISKESYSKIADLLEKHPGVSLTMNISGSLIQQLEREGFGELIIKFKKLAEKGRIELTGSAAYHPILPELPKREIKRQIKLNNKINQSAFGSAYDPRGFFPPEIAYSRKVGEILEDMGFRYSIIDSTALADWKKYLDFIYMRRAGRMLLFPREDSLSYKIAFGRISTKLGLIRAIGANQVKKRKFVVLAMDGETFGHHQPKQLRFLAQLFRASYKDSRIKLVSLSEILKLYSKRKSVEPVTSTWGYTEVVEGKRIWVRWSNPRNPLHQVLAEMRHLAIEAVDKEGSESREMLDQGLNSDTFWWASGKPYWHPGMIRSGGELLYKAVSLSDTATIKQKRRARYLYKTALKREIEKLRTKKQRHRVLDLGERM